MLFAKKMRQTTRSGSFFLANDFQQSPGFPFLQLKKVTGYIFSGVLPLRWIMV
jgi:hypothetical protein